MILATRNRGKIREIQALLSDLGLEVCSLDDVPQMPEVVEDGTTFFANALKKASAVALATGELALADDSGLEVDALGGAPGIYSARYAGPDADDLKNNARLLEDLARVPEGERSARFRCVLVVYCPSGHWMSAEGTCEGTIAKAAFGSRGFGYDPIFYLPAFGRTMAEVGPEIKNRISHRAQALARLREILPRFLREQRDPVDSEKEYAGGSPELPQENQ